MRCFMATKISIFEEKTWTVERAIIYICLDWDQRGSASELLELASAIGAWLRNGTLQIPSQNREAGFRTIEFVAKLKALHGENINTVEMLPALWTWFAMDKARQSISTAFRNKFELWLTTHLLQGSLPVVQHKNKNQKWTEINLDSYPLSGAAGVPVALLGVRRFMRVENLDFWRMQLYPLVTDPVNASTTGLDKEPNKIPLEKNSGTSDVPDASRSSGCEQLIVKALEKISRQKKSTITEVKSPTANGIRFEASGLGQRELLALVMKIVPGLKSPNYRKFTVRRSLSFVIRSRRGRPPKCAQAPKKLVVAKVAKRRR